MHPLVQFPRYFSRQLAHLSLLFALCLGLSCTANVPPRAGSTSRNTDPNVGVNPTPTTPMQVGPSPGNTAPTGSVPVGANGMPLVPPEPGPAALRRLTNQEYRNTIQDLLKLPAPPTDPLIPETQSNGYNNFAAALTVPPTLLEQYQTLATRLAKDADIASLAPCVPPASESDCARSFVQTFGASAFRRPLTSAEVDKSLALYALGQMGATYADGIRHVLETMLYSPHLLYRFELGTPLADTRHALTPYEVASELSYLFTASPPDAELVAAAASDALATSAQLEAQARRLLGQARAHQQLRGLLTQWFELPRLPDLTKDPVLYPTFTSSLVASMANESNAFIDSVMWEGDARLSTLLTAPYSFANAELANLYGMPDPGTGADLSRVKLDPRERAGLLTQASVLAAHSKPGDSAPIKRGKFVRTVLLCQPLAPPLPSVIKITVPPPDPTLTTRERFAAHSANPTCAGCHSLIDGVGFGLENFDAIGQFRTSENNKPVDAGGMLTGTDVNGAFSGGVELATKLSTSAQVATCAGLQTYRWMFGRMESPGEPELVQALVGQLGQGQVDLRELLVALTKTDSFLVRTFTP